MSVNCNDRERILAGDSSSEMEALRRHAEGCAACRAELDVWDGITSAAPLLQKAWESPALWPRIRQALAEESLRAPQPGSRVCESLGVAAAGPHGCRGAGPGGDFRTVRPPYGPGPQTQQRLLNDQALRDAEKAEGVYVQSIENLARLAQPRLEQAATPLMQNYREKLLVLDSAINELRAQAEQNRYNAHLRQGMKMLYQEKQRTLEDVLREER